MTSTDVGGAVQVGLSPAAAVVNLLDRLDIAQGVNQSSNGSVVSATVQQLIQLYQGGAATVFSVNGLTGNVVLGVANIAGAAPLSAPSFTGGINVTGNAALNGGVTVSGNAGVTGTLTVSGITGANLTATTATTAAPGTINAGVATNAFVAAAITAAIGALSSGVVSVAGNTGAVTLAQLLAAGLAPSASPTFSGTVNAATINGAALTNVTATTPSPGTNNTAVATTAFVAAAITAAIGLISTGVLSVAGLTGAVTLAQLLAAGLAPAASPTFTGTVTAPAITGAALTNVTATTAAPGTNNTAPATTAFVGAAITAALGSITGVSSVVGQTGAVTLAQLLTAGVAPIAAPVFTGTVATQGARIRNTIVFDGFSGVYRGLANYTVVATDDCIIVNKIPVPPATSTGPTTITIPTPGTTGRDLVIKGGKGDEALNNITIAPVSGVIDGGSPLIISSPYGSVCLRDAGGQWNIIAQN